MVAGVLCMWNSAGLPGDRGFEKEAVGRNLIFLKELRSTIGSRWPNTNGLCSPSIGLEHVNLTFPQSCYLSRKEFKSNEIQ